MSSTKLLCASIALAAALGIGPSLLQAAPAESGGVNAGKPTDFRQAAERGDAAAQFKLGIAYSCGNSVAKDEAEAVKWFRQAAEQGHAEAQYHLGRCHEFGLGVARNEAEAIKWYGLAAGQRSEPARESLGRIARHGSIPAQLSLGTSYENQVRSMGRLQIYTTTKSPQRIKAEAEAMKWFRMAADLGSAEGQNKVGDCHARGFGGIPNTAEAVRWYRKAAENGYAKAQCYIGGRYENGIGIVQDKAEALKWYRKAADQGFAPAQEALRRLEK